MLLQIKKSSDALLKSDARADQNQVIFFTSPKGEEGDFKGLSENLTKDSVFYFNRHYYRQKDGVAMGITLGSSIG